METQNNKKLLIMAAVAAVVLLVIVIFILVFANTKKGGEEKQSADIISPTSIPVSEFPTAYPTIVLRKTHNAEGYKIKFPDEWDSTTNQVIGGGTLANFFAVDSNQAEMFPRIDIQVTPISTSSVPITMLVNNLSPLQLKQNSTFFRGIQATKLSGELPFVFNVGNPPKPTKVNKTFLFFDKNNKRYIIDYAYYIDEDQESSKALINQVLDTYEFN